MHKNFTKKDVKKEAKRRFQGSVSTDMLEAAMECETLDDAVDVILTDTVSKASPTNDPYDINFWTTILPPRE